MKKLVLSALGAFLLSVTGVFAQVTVIFQVDMTDSVTAIGATGVSIAGDFSARGSAQASWSPPAGALTDAGNNIWEKSIDFDGTAVDSLPFKFIIGNDWGRNEGKTGTLLDRSCSTSDGGGNVNRKFKIPTTPGVSTARFFYDRCGDIFTSISTFEEKQIFSVSPNPASNNLNIRFSGTKSSQIKMTDLTGRTVRTFSGNDNLENISVAGLPTGLYYVTVIDGSKLYKTPVVITK